MKRVHPISPWRSFLEALARVAALLEVDGREVPVQKVRAMRTAPTLA